MTDIAVQRERFNLSEDELELTRFAYQQVAKRIMDRAAADDYAQEDLAGAAATFHLASTLAGEVGVALGEEAPDEESLGIVASCIALGEAPAASAAALASPPPLGAHADVPVSPEEDERCAGDVNSCSQECEQEGCQA